MTVLYDFKQGWTMLSNSPLAKRAIRNCKEIFGLDRRSMALYRVCLGITILYDLYIRSLDLKAHYSDEGVLPRIVILEHFYSSYWMSLHMLYGSVFYQQILFSFHALCALSLLLGYRTRVATILCWILQNSVNNRNILLLYGGDLYIRVLLFWSIFLPLSDCFSIDSLSKEQQVSQYVGYYTGTDDRFAEQQLPNYATDDDADDKNRDKRTRSIRFTLRNTYDEKNMYISGGTIAYLLQITIMYVYSYLPKTGNEWHVDGTATFLALNLDFFRTPIGDLALMLPAGLLSTLTIAVLYWEGFGVLCWFSPFLTGPLRTFGVVGFVFMHMNFWACMRLEMFGAITMSAPLCLLPSWFWDEVVFRFLRLRKSRQTLRIYYQSHCEWCSKLFQFLSTFFLIPGTKMYSISHALFDSRDHEASRFTSRSDPIILHLNNPNTLWIASIDGPYGSKVYRTNIEALAIIFQESPFLWPFAYLIRKTNIINYGDRFISVFFHTHQDNDMLQSTHKEEFGNSSKQFKRKPKVSGINWSNILSKVTSGLCLFLIYLVLCWNMANVQTKLSSSFRMPSQSARNLFVTLQLDQIWDMFAPRPPSIDWWFNIESTLEDGTSIDLFGDGGLFNWEGRPHTWDKPDVYKAMLRHRWFKYYERLGNHPAMQTIRLHYGRYICREYNARHHGPKRLKTFKIWWISEIQLLTGETKPGSKLNLWEHVC